MTDEIPDDVVEKALSTYWGADWTGACMDEAYKGRTDAMRAALRVAVEWEREQCAIIASRIKPNTNDLDDEAAMLTHGENIAAAIRSRKKKSA